MVRPALITVAALAALAAAAPGAGAHAALTAARPADGAALATAPRQVQLAFGEALSGRFRVVQLLDGHGRIVAGTRLLPAGGDARRLALAVPRLRRGTYEVTWEVLAQGDGHVTGGAVVFGVGTAAGAAPRRAPGAGPSPPEAALRWADLTLYAVLAGALVVGMLLHMEPAGRAPGAPTPAVGRVLAGAMCSSALGLGLGAVLLVRQAGALVATLPPHATIVDALPRLLPARWGVLWLTREALLAAALVVCALLVVRLRRGAVVAPRALGPLGAVVAALALVRALGSHAATVPGPAAHVAAAAVHELAAATWIGGVVALSVAVWPAGGRARPQAAAAVLACGRRFAWVAAVSGVALAASGLYAAGAQVASVDGLVTTGYGATLLAKLGLAAAAAALGAANFLLVRRGRRGARTASRVVALEAGVGLGVLLAAGQLGATAPPRGPEFAAPRPVRAPTLVRRAGDLLVSATARPNRPGVNVVTVLVASSRRPPPGPIDAVAVRAAPTGGPAGPVVALRRVGSGRWAGGARLARPGRWTMTVTVRRGGRRLALPLRWTVAPPDAARPVVVSARRLAPPADAAAAAVVLAAVAAVAGWWALAAARRRASRRRPSARPVAQLGEEAT